MTPNKKHLALLAGSICTLLIAWVVIYQPWRSEVAIGDRWQLQIEDLAHHVKVEATVQLTNQADKESCIAGNWKRLAVVASSGNEPDFFPISGPLAYQLEGAMITLGRTRVCDGYRFLTGKLADAEIQGAYDSVGLGSDTRLGYFRMERVR